MGRASRWKPARLGEKLLAIREKLGLSQNEMIQRLGFDDLLYRTNISSYEIEGREPPLPVLLQYARVAGVPMEVLVDDKLDLPERLRRSRARATSPIGKTRHKGRGVRDRRS